MKIKGFLMCGLFFTTGLNAYASSKKVECHLEDRSGGFSQGELGSQESIKFFNVELPGVRVDVRIIRTGVDQASVQATVQRPGQMLGDTYKFYEPSLSKFEIARTANAVTDRTYFSCSIE